MSGLPKDCVVPDKWDKRLLVWYKEYPSIDAVPNAVSRATAHKIKSRFRVHSSIAAMVGCSLLILYSVGGASRSHRKRYAGLCNEMKS